MNRRKLRMLVLVCLGASATLCLLLATRDRDSEQAHHRRWRRYGAFASRLNSLEHLLGMDAASILGVQRLERLYEHKWEAEMEALIRSGYLVRLQFSVTNLASRREQVAREWFSLPDHGEGNEGITGSCEASNLITFVCRPKYAAVFATLFQWRSPDSSLSQRAAAAVQLVPRGTRQCEAQRILGPPTRYAHFRAPAAAEPGYASLTNDLRLPDGTLETEAQSVWCDFYEFPGGEYVCVAFDAKAARWWADRPLIKVWFGRTNDAQTIRFPKNER